MPGIVLSAEDIIKQYRIPTPRNSHLKELDNEYVVIAVVQLLSHVHCFVTPRTAAHCLLEFAQTHFHRVSDAIQPPYPPMSPFPPSLNLSQHQVLFQWVSSLQQVAKALQL